jgi:hypothetical protein
MPALRLNKHRDARDGAGQAAAFGMGYTSRSVSRQLRLAGVKMRPPGYRVLRGVNRGGMPTLYRFSKES